MGWLNLKLSAQKLLSKPALPVLTPSLQRPFAALLNASLRGPTSTFSSSPALTSIEGFWVT